jgi:hypothetical protein
MVPKVKTRSDYTDKLPQPFVRWQAQKWQSDTLA